jgi:hypothetical protein
MDEQNKSLEVQSVQPPSWGTALATGFRDVEEGISAIVDLSGRRSRRLAQRRTRKYLLRRTGVTPDLVTGFISDSLKIGTLIRSSALSILTDQASRR